MLGGTVVLQNGPSTAPPPRVGLPNLSSVAYRPAQTGDILFPVDIRGWWGYANQAGVLNIYPAFQWADYFHDNFARVVVDGKTGFISRLGRFVIPAKFPYADRFQNGYAIVGDGKGHFGFINEAGRLIVPIKLTGALRFSENYAAVQVGKRIGFINQAGGVLIRPQFAKARSFHDHLAMVQAMTPAGKPGAVGYIDAAGNLIWHDATGRLTNLGSFYDGMARVKIGKHWGYLNRAFHLAIPAVFQDARHFSHGLAAVKLHDKWGYINIVGHFQVSPQFQFAGYFGKTYGMIEQHGLFGYVNQNASGGIKPQFHQAQPFYRRRARVSVDPSFGYIDVSGRPTWDPRTLLHAPLVDISIRGQLAVKTDPYQVASPVLQLPKPNTPRAPAYPPAYQYPDVLPQPGGAFGN